MLISCLDYWHAPQLYCMSPLATALPAVDVGVPLPGWQAQHVSAAELHGGKPHLAACLLLPLLIKACHAGLWTCTLRVMRDEASPHRSCMVI